MTEFEAKENNLQTINEDEHRWCYWEHQCEYCNNFDDNSCICQTNAQFINKLRLVERDEHYGVIRFACRNFEYNHKKGLKLDE